MDKRKFGLVHRPESHEEISRLVRGLLARSDSFDVLPTPIDRHFEFAKVREIEDLPEPDGNFLSSLGERALNAFFVSRQKIRGIADMRRRVVYIPKNDKPPRILFAQGHELGHQCMPWHNIEQAFQDDNYSLCPEVNALFEQEANHFSSEAIFQGSSRFQRRARDYRVDLNSVFYLADLHGASKHATAWRFAEEQDYPVAALYYYPCKWRKDQMGNSVLLRWRAAASPKFLAQYSDIEFPDFLASDHPWAAALASGEVVSGIDQFRYGGKDTVMLEWQSWWNQYALIVLARRRPIIASLSSAILGR
ncbi:MAG: hypothetical protein WA198_09920 [Candidatus Sulfotelmatobacter sp.]